jgi:hypothetical protein
LILKLKIIKYLNVNKIIKMESILSLSIPLDTSNIYKFPKYPFIWNYEDMYNFYDYHVEEYIKDSDQNIIELLKIFENYKIVKTKQIIKKDNIKNINLHTWYLSEDNIFESDDKEISIIINKRIDYKKNVFGFIFDPNNIFEISYDLFHNIHNKDKHKKISIIKDIRNVKKDLKLYNYIHVHSIRDICRFSPDTNNIIKIKNDIQNNIFYIILDKIIVINEFFII